MSWLTRRGQALALRLDRLTEALETIGERLRHAIVTAVG